MLNCCRQEELVLVFIIVQYMSICDDDSVVVVLLAALLVCICLSDFNSPLLPRAASRQSPLSPLLQHLAGIDG